MEWVSWNVFYCMLTTFCKYGLFSKFDYHRENHVEILCKAIDVSLGLGISGYVGSLSEFVLGWESVPKIIGHWNAGILINHL